MVLHVPTLALVAVFVTAILGVLLLAAWRREQQSNALIWWGAAYLIGTLAFGLLALRNMIPDVLSIDIANAVMLVGYAFLVAGARSFNGRDMPPAAFMIAPLLWLVAMRVPAFAADINYRIMLASVCQAALTGLVAYEFWRQREPLMSRWPTIVVLALHMTGLLLRVPVFLTSPMPEVAFLHGATFATLAFGTILFTITFAFLLLSMVKERGEFLHKQASLIDPLTGLANRRAFMAVADATIAGRASRGNVLAVLLADLDHFKKINDVFGHAVGDRVLKTFAAALRRVLGMDILAGRIGGEEFAILVTEDGEAATALAERIRHAFAEAAAEIDGHALAATVSIGVAVSRIGGQDLAGLLGRADSALYQAKAGGRNRVAAYADDGACEDAPPLAPISAEIPAAPRFMAI